MSVGDIAPSPSNNPAIRELEGVLARIGVTNAHKQIIALILVGCLFDAFEQNTIGIVGPALRATWGLSATDIGFLNTVTFGSAAIGRLLSGFISDRHGRRTMLGINLILFTIGSMGCALSPSFTILCLFRAIVGFGVGGEVSTAVTMLSEFCSPKFRGTAAGLVNVGAGGLGNFLAPAFGLLIFTIFAGDNSWRWLFASLGAPCLLIVFYRRLVPETPRFLVSQGKIAQANRVLSILASGSLNPRNVPTTEYLTPPPATQEDKKFAGWAGIFQGPYLIRTISVAVSILMSYGAQLSVLTLMPIIFVSMGYNYSSSLLYTMIIQFGSLCGTIAASVFGYHLPRKRVLTAGAICACVAALCIVYLGVNIYLVLMFGSIFQFFVLLLNTSIWIYAPELYPTRMRAFGVAFILAAGSAAGSLVPPISGALFGSYGVAGVFGLAAAMYVVFAVCIQFGPETYGRSMEDPNLPAETFDGAVGAQKFA